MNDWYQFIDVNGFLMHSKVKFGVLQGLLLFALYMLPLNKIFHKHDNSFPCCANDTERTDKRLQLNKAELLVLEPHANISKNYVGFSV